MLTLEKVTKDYGRYRAVENISLHLEHGLYGILAPNGAGKTTILKMITMLLFPTEGQILYDGVEINQLGAAYRERIGYLPQQFGYYKNNTPTQYIEYLAALKGMPKEGLAGRIAKVLDEVGLSDVANVKMKKFSGGMIQRVGIAQAMINDPEILILDEPTAGLDPKERVRFRNIISAYSRDRIVLLSTHIVSDIESIANQVIMLKDKRISQFAPVSEICDKYAGCIYECRIPDGEYEEFSKEYFVLSARQEHEAMNVRYFADGESGLLIQGDSCVPNLEDVFLLEYREESGYEQAAERTANIRLTSAHAEKSSKEGGIS